MQNLENAAGAASPVEADEEALRKCLESVVAERFGARTAITSVLRSGYDLSHSYASDILHLRLSDGQELRIFLKDFGARTRIKDGFQGMRDRRERELRAYRDLLAGAALGTPEYLGSVWGEGGRYCLLLEFVEGSKLRHTEFGHWIPAANWLARLQCHFAPRSDQLNECAWLQVHDDQFFRFRAQRALESLAGSYPSLVAALQPIVNRYDGIIGFMADQERTFVHGSYTPGTIFIDTKCRPPRICPFDWELAGLGSKLYDVAFLCDGFDEIRLDILLRAYEEQTAACGMNLMPRKDTTYLIDCLRLHRIMNFISQTDERDYSEKDARRLVTAAQRMARLVL